MSSSRNIVFATSLFLAAILSAFQVLAQPAMNGRDDLAKRSGVSGLLTPPGRIEINSVYTTQSGKWLSFKNWNEAKCVVAESDSIVWVGTAVGLVRWNVVTQQYQTFDELSGLLFTSINGLALDSSGRLWLATTQGIAIRDGGAFSYIDHSNSNLPATSIRHILFDSQGRAVVSCGWFLQRNEWVQGGICVENGPTWDIYSIPNIYSAFGPPEAMIAYKDTVFVSWHTLYTLANGELKPVPSWSFFGPSSFAVDYQDSLWIESGGRTSKWLGGQWQVVVDREQEHLGSLWSQIWNDPRGGLWLSYGNYWWAGYGPFRLDIGVRRSGGNGISGISGIPGQFGGHCARGPLSQFFVSTGIAGQGGYPKAQGGLFKFDGSQWEIFRVPSPLLANHIDGLGCGQEGDILLSAGFYTQQTDGRTWKTIGNDLTGVRGYNNDFRFAPDGMLFTNHDQLYPERDSYSGFATGLDFDGYGNLWTTYPLRRYYWPGMRSKTFSDSAMGIEVTPQHYSPQFMDVVADKEEKIWAAAWYYGGIMYDRTLWHPLVSDESRLPNSNYDYVFADSKDRIWFGTNQWSPNFGFSMYDGADWHTFYSPQDGSISYLNQMTEDHVGNVWLATGGGLVRYDGSSFVVFNQFNSPLKRAVTAVTADLRGNLWIGTDAGLYIYNPLGPVELAAYLNTSPVDSLRVSFVDTHARAEFIPRIPMTSPMKYFLERGRGVHKYWVVAELNADSTAPTRLSIVDSSSVIGHFFYRIKAVTTEGKVQYSAPVSVAGGSTGVVLKEFAARPVRERISFRWKTEGESFVSHFEILRQNQMNGPIEVILRVPSTFHIDGMGEYSAEGDSVMKEPNLVQYKLRVVFKDSTRTDLRTLTINRGSPLAFKLLQNYPNPFNPVTTIDYALSSTVLVILKVYDLLGQEVATLVNGIEDPGYKSVSLDASKLSSGIYFYRLQAGGYTEVKKLVLLK